MRTIPSPWRDRLKEEHRYPHQIKLPVHPNQIGKRDPRRVWVYDCSLGKSSVEDTSDGPMTWVTTHRIYSFADEADATMFVLRWGGQCGN